MRRIGPGLLRQALLGYKVLGPDLWMSQPWDKASSVARCAALRPGLRVSFVFRKPA